MFGKCLFLALSITVKWLLDIETFIMRKNINYFECVEVRILVLKLNIYQAHILPSSLVQTSSLERTTLNLNAPIKVNKKFQNSHYFYWYLDNLLTFMCSHLITSIIVHTRRPNTQENICNILPFYVSHENIFSHFEQLKRTFFTLL